MLWILFFPLTAGLFAQSERAISVSPGFKIGSPVNDSATRDGFFYNYTQSRWTGGPSLEIRLPRKFAVEVNALYRTYRQNESYSFSFGQNLNPYSATLQKSASAWDFPLLLKYRFQIKSIRPFVSAGYSWTRHSVRDSALFLCQGPQDSCRTPESQVDPRSNFSRRTEVSGGVVAGTGIEFKTRHVVIAPEVRFSRPDRGYPRDNRVTAIVGFTFGK